MSILETTFFAILDKRGWISRVLGPLILCFLPSVSAFATPEKITVYFLSEQQVQAELQKWDHKQAISMSRLFLAESLYECVPMGEGCFHPQLGYLEERPAKLKKLPTEPIPESMQLKTFNSDDVELIECREGQYFDIFCGQTRKKSELRNGGLEIWFDVSASMRKTDYSKDMQFCHRRSFANALTEGCAVKPILTVYNTSFKEITDLSQICLTSGTNSVERTIDWIKGSRAKHLVIITDTEEYSGAMRDFLSAEGAEIKGIEDGNLYSSDLVKFTKSLQASCKE